MGRHALGVVADSLNCRRLDGTDGHKTSLMITGIFSRSATNFGLILTSNLFNPCSGIFKKQRQSILLRSCTSS